MHCNGQTLCLLLCLPANVGHPAVQRREARSQQSQSVHGGNSPDGAGGPGVFLGDTDSCMCVGERVVEAEEGSRQAVHAPARPGSTTPASHQASRQGS